MPKFRAHDFTRVFFFPYDLTPSHNTSITDDGRSDENRTNNSTVI